VNQRRFQGDAAKWPENDRRHARIPDVTQVTLYERRGRMVRGPRFPMGFWAGYFSSIKPREVEEPIDVWVHRPLAYVLARAVFPTPISPDFITGLSIVFGIASGVCFVWDFPWHLQVGAFLLFFSAVLDCADGQLARMRKTSSAFGRMLDGVADLITICAAAPATGWVIWRMFATPWWQGAIVMALFVATLVTSSFHTGMYDHYKNVFLRLTSPDFKEGEDYETAVARYEAQKGQKTTLVSKIAWPIYFFYMKSQGDVVRKFDPYTSARLNSFPPYDPERAAIYRELAGPVMRVWRSLFGFGSLVFGLALFNAFGHPEIYLALRLVVLNAIFYGYLRPAQRRASKEAFRRMNLVLPDQKAPEAVAA